MNSSNGLADLNPIKNVWAWIKVQLKNSSPTNLEQLKEEILKLWVIRMEDSAYLKNLVEPIPWRLQEVVEQGGNITHY